MEDGLTKTNKVQLLVESYLEKKRLAGLYSSEAIVRDAEFDIMQAMKIARRFKHWDKKSQKEKVELASEIKEHKEFYVQLGKDIDKEYQAGVDVMVQVFGALDSVEV